MKKLVLLSLLVLAAFLFVACAPQMPEVEIEITPVPGPEVGRPAPDFKWKEGSFSDYRGKIVLLVFWSPGCRYCLEELPILEDLYRRHKDQLVIIGVTRMEIEGVEVTFPNLIDERGVLHNLYQILRYPTIFVVDQEGMIHTRHEGYLPLEELEKILKEL